MQIDQNTLNQKLEDLKGELANFDVFHSEEKTNLLYKYNSTNNSVIDSLKALQSNEKVIKTEQSSAILEGTNNIAKNAKLVPKNQNANVSQLIFKLSEVFHIAVPAEYKKFQTEPSIPCSYIKPDTVNNSPVNVIVNYDKPMELLSDEPTHREQFYVKYITDKGNITGMQLQERAIDILQELGVELTPTAKVEQSKDNEKLLKNTANLGNAL